jgi:hypothetical protein
MFITRFSPICFAGDAGAGTGDPAPGNPTPQPGAPGQGQTDPNAGFNWGLFPDVDEAMRPQLEPHLRNVQGHVTRLEQQMAPFKPFVDAGYTPDQVQGLAQFADSFAQDPAGTWLAMAKQLQDEGRIDQDLDLDAVARIAMGQGPAPEEQPTQSQFEGVVPPQVAQYIAQLESRLSQLEGGFEQQNQAQRQAQNRELLNNAISTVREALIADGYPEEALTDIAINGALVASRGQPQAAIQALQAQRTALLQGFTKTNQENTAGKELHVANGGPKVPTKTPAKRGDPYAGARAGASQYLKTLNQGAAQGT